ncbi:MAG TPA: EamA family transporter [Gammaproteobacteria bacterium]|nr:EamA family transporter [Gammaproteobacteria bacterium]
MTAAVLSLILLTACLNTAAQLLLKAGMVRIGEFGFAAHNIVPIFFKIASSPFILLGLVVYVGSMTLWLLVLSRVPVGIAYPMTSLAYIFNVLGAYIIFSEQINLVQIVGILVIILGVYLIAQH